MSRAQDGLPVCAGGWVGRQQLSNRRLVWRRWAIGASGAADKGEASCPLKKSLFPARIWGGAVLAGARTQDAGGRRKIGEYSCLPLCVFIDPGAGLLSPEWCVWGGQRDRSRPGTWARGAPALPRNFSVHLSRALCWGEKEGVKSSKHMAPLFTMIKEGGHDKSLGSLGDTL